VMNGHAFMIYIYIYTHTHTHTSLSQCLVLLAYYTAGGWSQIVRLPIWL
jgi:hypothetical protein